MRKLLILSYLFATSVFKITDGDTNIKNTSHRTTAVDDGSTSLHLSLLIIDSLYKLYCSCLYMMSYQSIII